ncbi:MAG: hypothetical protein IJ291_03245 [Lachnospiraceae bacterium]|nr:hypothetical protein [Lachnospiraceae bacterium]
MSEVKETTEETKVEENKEVKTEESKVEAKNEEIKAAPALTIVPDLETADEKSKKDFILELVIAVCLGLSIIGMAWTGWIASIHSENQSKNLAEATALNAQGTNLWTEQSQYLMKDMMVWEEINDLRFEIDYAKEADKANDLAKAEKQLKEMLANEVSGDFLIAVEWAMAQKEYASPFDMEGYTVSYYAEAQALLDQAAAKAAQAENDRTYADCFLLLTVLYGVVLFMLGISAFFKGSTTKMVLCIISGIAFVLITAYIFTLPLPVGFDFVSYLVR